VILSDQHLGKALEMGDLVIDPLNQSAIQPASVDLTLGDEFLYWQSLAPRAVIDMAESALEAPRMCRVIVGNGMGFDIAPGQFVLSTTSETVGLGPGHAARVEGRSSIGRFGLMVHATAGFIDPGFKGKITLEMYNLSPHSIRIYPGQSICQIAVSTLSGPAQRIYGPGRGSKYHGQTGVTASRWRGKGDGVA
jgi:dCTP deaminase